MRSIRPPPRVNPSLFEPQPNNINAPPSFREASPDVDFNAEVQAEMRRQEAFLEEMLRDQARIQEYDRHQREDRVSGANNPPPRINPEYRIVDSSRDSAIRQV